MIVILALAWAGILVGVWLGWQLLRQNGRMLLRLDELEKRLDELLFDDGQEPKGLPPGSEAPAFGLPDLSDEHKSLAQFRGQPVLLIFFNPGCGFCREMAPKLREKAETEDGAACPFSLIVSTGDAESNRQLFAAHEMGCSVLLQQDGEIAKAYQAHGTPSGYLIDAEGKIASELTIGAEALLKLADGKAEISTQKAEMGQGLSGPGAGNGDGRESHFGNRSLARSKIKRDGLKAGTPAPDFRLARLDGGGDLTLSELRGKRVLLVFSSPGCGPCNTLAPELEEFHREQTKQRVGRVTPCAPQRDGLLQNGAHGVTRPTLISTPIAVVMISKGEPKENRTKVKEHGLTFPVVLQQQWEISRRYAMFATPVAYLIDEHGVILKDVAVGVEAIQALTAEARHWSEQPTVLARQEVGDLLKSS